MGGITARERIEAMTTPPKERPILFSAAMVKAILDGRKTQTRRVIKPQFSKTWGQGVRNQDPDYFSVHVDIREPNSEWRWLRCPYGKPGDRLWVKETWGAIWPDLDPVPLRECKIEYRADSPYASYPGGWPADEARGNPDAPKWQSPLFMPRLASRITLEIVSIRAERLFDISEEDARAEGVSIEATRTLTHRGAFAITWDSINAKRGYTWESNPWIWAISFKVVQP